MPNPNPYDELFEQIADLLSFAQDNEDKGISDKKLDKNIEKQLDELEKGVELFRKITDEAVKQSGLEEEDVRKSIQQPPDDLGKVERRVLEKARKLRGDLESMEQEYAKKARMVKLQKKKSKTAGKKRKKKFKRLGGEGWMPL